MPVLSFRHFKGKMYKPEAKVYDWILTSWFAKIKLFKFPTISSKGALVRPHDKLVGLTKLFEKNVNLWWQLTLLTCFFSTTSMYFYCGFVLLGNIEIDCKTALKIMLKFTPGRNSPSRVIGDMKAPCITLGFVRFVWEAPVRIHIKKIYYTT